MKPKKRTTGLPEDMHDSEKVLQSFPQLSQPLKQLRVIEQRFSDADEAASVFQTRHKMIVAVAAIFGTLAIILAILQLTLVNVLDVARHEEIRIVVVAAEAGAVLLAISAVSWGGFGRVHQKWLEHRHRAERYRFVKFAALIDPYLMNENGQMAWKAKLESDIDEVTRSSAHDWAVEEDPHDRPPTTSEIKVGPEVLRELIDYYFQKRLRIQKRYFGDQSRRHDKSNWYTRLPPPILFFGSVLFALLHVLIELITGLRDEKAASAQTLSLIAVISVAAAAILPVCGGGIRTARAAFEFSRHTLRFRAKYNALSKLEESLELHREALAGLKSSSRKETELATSIYGDLWMCEHVLEYEQREWLRLMIEAEWFA
jgi:hypothetical protein